MAQPDEAWFASAYQADQRQVRQYLVRRVGPRDADTLLDQVFTDAWRARGSAPDALLPGLLAIARTHVAALDPADRLPQTDPIVQQLFDSLSAEQAEVLRLTYWDLLSLKQIGQTLGLTTGAVRARLRTAERQARSYLDPAADPDGIAMPDLIDAEPAPTPTLAYLLDNDPAEDLRPLDDDLAADRAATIIESAPVEPITWPTPPDPYRRRRLIALVGVLVVLVAFGPLLWRQVIEPLTRPEPHPRAVQVLTKAAERPAAPIPGPGQWLRVEAEGSMLFDRGFGDDGTWRRLHQISYTSSDLRWNCEDNRGSGDPLPGDQTPATPEPTNDSSPTCWRAMAVPTPIPDSEAEFRDWVHNASSGNIVSDQEADFGLLSWWLVFGISPEGIEQLAYRMLAELPDIAVIHPDVATPGGRAVAIGLPETEASVQVLLIMNPRTGELLGYQYSARPGPDANHEAVAQFLFTRSVLDELPAEVVAAACEAARSGIGSCPQE